MYIFFEIIILFQILLTFYTSTAIPNRYISIPFTINVPDKNSISNSQSFLDKYFNNNIILDLSIGENSQSVSGIINQDQTCFEFLEKGEGDVPNPKNLLNFFSPKKSSSFSIKKEVIKISYQPDEYTALGSDFFSFDEEKYNMSFSLKKVKNEEEINLDEIKDKNYIAKIGLILPSREIALKEYCPQFFHDVKKIGNLSKYIISFEFDEENNNKGKLIFGDEMFNYNNKKYFESQYLGSYSSENHQIYYNGAKIILNGNNNINITEGTYSIFNYNLGVIIGIEKYRKKIEQYFFDDLINKKICSSDPVKYNNTNYITYSCDEGNFKEKIKSFPKLVFNSKSYEYDFELTYSDLFIKINSKYYFLIIFKELNGKNTWIFGHPFYKKFQFTINLDENWVGFYNPNKEKIARKENPYNTEDKSTKIKKILLIVGLVILVIGLSVGMFFLGRKLKNDRKKRANELVDENYDYSAGINPS